MLVVEATSLNPFLPYCVAAHLSNRKRRQAAHIRRKVAAQGSLIVENAIAVPTMRSLSRASPARDVEGTYISMRFSGLCDHLILRFVLAVAGDGYNGLFDNWRGGARAGRAEFRD